MEADEDHRTELGERRIQRVGRLDQQPLPHESRSDARRPGDLEVVPHGVPERASDESIERAWIPRGRLYELTAEPLFREVRHDPGEVPPRPPPALVCEAIPRRAGDLGDPDGCALWCT